jgi:hypothetical protein
VEWECVREVNNKERKAKADRLDAVRAQKQQEKGAATAKKLEQAKRPFPTTSRLAALNSTKRRCVMGDASGHAAASLLRFDVITYQASARTYEQPTRYHKVLLGQQLHERSPRSPRAT